MKSVGLAVAFVLVGGSLMSSTAQAQMESTTPSTARPAPILRGSVTKSIDLLTVLQGKQDYELDMTWWDYQRQKVLNCVFGPLDLNSDRKTHAQYACVQFYKGLELVESIQNERHASRLVDDMEGMVNAKPGTKAAELKQTYSLYYQDVKKMPTLVLRDELAHNLNLKRVCDDLEQRYRNTRIKEEAQAIWVALQQIPEEDRKQIIESAQSHYRNSMEAARNANYHATTAGDAALKALDNSMQFATENASKVSTSAQTVWAAYRKQPRDDSKALEEKLLSFLPSCQKGAMQAAVNQYELSVRTAAEKAQHAGGYDSAELLGLNNPPAKQIRSMREVLPEDFPESSATTPASQGMPHQH